MTQQPLIPDDALLSEHGRTTPERDLGDVLGGLTDEEFRAWTHAVQTGKRSELKTMGDLRHWAGLPLANNK